MYSTWRPTKGFMLALIKREKEGRRDGGNRKNTSAESTKKTEEGSETRGTERQTEEGDRDGRGEGGGDMVPVHRACNASKHRQR